MSQLLNLYAVITLDGRIAKSPADPVEWSSREDKGILQEAIENHDLFIMGRVTYEICQELMESKECLVITRSPDRNIPNGKNLTFFNPESSNLRDYLMERSEKKMALFGGSSIYKLALEMDLVKMISLTLEPLILGGGISLTGDGEPWKIFEGWVLQESRRLNERGSLQLIYFPAKTGTGDQLS